ncbi:MAG: serine hydrolase [Eisenbergiella sp.]
MLLAESGELELDTPVGEYLPGFKNSRVWCGDHSEPADRPILISDLLTMTSGLTYGDDDTVTELATRKLLAEAEERLKGDNPMTTLEFAERQRFPSFSAGHVLEIWDIRGYFGSCYRKGGT